MAGSKFGPERLCRQRLGQSLAGPRHQRRPIGMGPRQAPCGEENKGIVAFALPDRFARLFFEKGGGRLGVMNGSERFLDPLQRIHETAITFGCSSFIGQRIEKGGLVAQLLGADAQVMQFRLGQGLQMFALGRQFLAAASQTPRQEALEAFGFFANREGLAPPGAILHPEHKIEQEFPAARAVHGFAQDLAGGRLAQSDEGGEFCKARRVRLPGDGRLDCLRQKHVDVTRGAQMVRKPFEICGEARKDRIGDQGAEQGEGRSQPPNGDPGLVDRLDLMSIFEGWRVEHHLPQAAMGDGGEGLGRAHLRIEKGRRHFNRGAPDAFRQSIAALALADEAERDGSESRQLAREGEKPAASTALQLQLDFKDRRARLPRDDLPLIDSHFDDRAGEAHLGLATGEARGEDRANLRTQIRIRQMFAQRGLGCLVEIKGRGVEGGFPFAALKTGSLLFHGLGDPVANLAQAKDEPRLLERAIRGVEIGGDLQIALRFAKGRQQGRRERRFQPCWRRQKLQLDFTPASHRGFQL